MDFKRYSKAYQPQKPLEKAKSDIESSKGISRQATKKLKKEYKGGDKLNKGEYYSKEFILAKTEGPDVDGTGNLARHYRNLKIRCVGYFTSEQYLANIEDNIEEANKRLKTSAAKDAPTRIADGLSKRRKVSKRDFIKKMVTSEFNQDLVFRYDMELYGMKWRYSIII